MSEKRHEMIDSQLFHELLNLASQIIWANDPKLRLHLLSDLPKRSQESLLILHSHEAGDVQESVWWSGAPIPRRISKALIGSNRNDLNVSPIISQSLQLAVLKLREHVKRVRVSKRPLGKKSGWLSRKVTVANSRQIGSFPSKETDEGWYSKRFPQKYHEQSAWKAPETM